MSQPIRVIIANDQSSIANMWQRLINRQPDMESPATAFNGEEVLKLVEEYQPHVVIMDVMMPGVDGLEATRQIVAQNNHTQVIVCSARSDIEDDALDAGAAEVLSLPLLPDILLKTIREIVK